MPDLKFGTSGLRGLVSDLAGEPARLWTLAFLRHLEATGRAGMRMVHIGRDLRASSPGIANDCAAAAASAGWMPVDCGALPTPALALFAGKAGAPAIMVTGSHIPDDRNGLKFYTAAGEIDKADEAGIRAEAERVGDVSSDGSPQPADAADAARTAYMRRYIDFFAPDALAGLTVGVYQQSSVARDILPELLSSLGARVESFDRADRFIPVDTEAHRPEDLAILRERGARGDLDTIVSTDGDADRPLVADERGDAVRGDLIGLLCARYLGLGTMVTPITSSSAMERSGVAARVVRTRVGSPFVIAAMDAALADGETDVIGFEANGGVLLGSPVVRDGRRLDALATRDAVLPILSVLALARSEQMSISRLVAKLGAGHALSDRLKEVPADRSGPFLRQLADDSAFAAEFFKPAGKIGSVDTLDGVRLSLDDGATVHFRASGNAPELRCYVEAAEADRARRLLDWGLGAARDAMA